METMDRQSVWEKIRELEKSIEEAYRELNELYRIVLEGGEDGK